MGSLLGIPDILYKYRVWEDVNHKNSIIGNELFYASSDLLNDPFDASLPFQYDFSILSKDSIIEKLIESGRKNWLGLSKEQLITKATMRFEEVEVDFGGDWNELYLDFKKKVNESIGIISLTSKNDNLLMWSHYANSHKGFCIGYDKIELFKQTQGVLGKVSYAEEFPILPFLSENVADLIDLIMTKSKHWEYEDEYRIIKSDAPRKKIILRDNSIKEIVFGCKMEKTSKEEIIAIALAKFPTIKFYDCVLDNKQFKLSIIPILNTL